MIPERLMFETRDYALQQTKAATFVLYYCVMLLSGIVQRDVRQRSLICASAMWLFCFRHVKRDAGHALAEYGQLKALYLLAKKGWTFDQTKKVQ